MQTSADQHVEAMIAKAATAKDSGDAMRWSQAACNAANALCAVGIARRADTDTPPTSGEE